MALLQAYATAPGRRRCCLRQTRTKLRLILRAQIQIDIAHLWTTRIACSDSGVAAAGLRWAGRSQEMMRCPGWCRRTLGTLDRQRSTSSGHRRSARPPTSLPTTPPLRSAERWPPLWPPPPSPSGTQASPCLATLILKQPDLLIKVDHMALELGLCRPTSWWTPHWQPLVYARCRVLPSTA